MGSYRLLLVAFACGDILVSAYHAFAFPVFFSSIYVLISHSIELPISAIMLVFYLYNCLCVYDAQIIGISTAFKFSYFSFILPDRP